MIFQLQKLKEESSKLNKFINIQDSIVILTDTEQFKFANQKFFDFFNYPNLEAFLREHNCICEFFIQSNGFFSLDMVKSSEKNWVESLLNLSGRKRVISMLDNTSVAHAFSVSINLYDDETYIVNFSDISDTMHEKLQLQEQVIIDQLTKAYNRLYLDKNIATLLEQHQHKEFETGIIFFDIDHFKDVNDTYGHHVGDEVLKMVVKITKNSIRDDDKLIRWGGEEFLILVPIHSIKALEHIANNIRMTIQNHPFESVKTLTCSFGLAIHQKNKDIYKSINSADEKLYEAKESGRNRVVY